MKKILYVILIGFTFLLASCGESLTDLPTDVPSLSLIGDASLIIEEGEPFIDPGVTIVGDFDLEVTTVSNVDVNTLGTYKITYTIEHNEISYDIVRTVVVVDGILISLDLEITDLSVTDGEASFTVNVNDTEDIILNAFVVIYSGDVIVTSYPFTGGTKTITYDDFLANTTYRIVLEGQYKVGVETRELNGYFIEFTTSDFTVAIPEIMLTGDKDTYVNVYEEFSDPGATVSGLFDLEITTVSTVDSYMLGDYMITYSVDYMGETYSVVRNVHVIDFQSLLGAMNILYTRSNIEFTSFDAFISIEDPNEYLKELKIVLTLDDNVIKESDINNGDNYLYFTDLEEGTEYTLTLEGTYNDGSVSLELVGYYYTITTKLDVQPTISLISSEAQPREYSVTVSVVDPYEKAGTIQVALLQDGELFDNESLILGSNEISFTSLAENTEYVLQLSYTYYDEDSNYIVVEEILETITTPGIPMPSITSDSCTAFTTTVECSMVIDETGFSDVTIYYSIFIGYHVQASLSLENGETDLVFENLVDNQEYTMKISTTYTDDATGVTYMYERIKIFTLTTEEIVTFTAPTVENLVVTPSFIDGKLSITVGFDLLDPDETIGDWMYFYLGSKNEIPVVGHNEYTYTGYAIYENTEYIVKVKANYDTSAEETLYQEELIVYEFITPIQMTVDSFTAADSYFVGDNVVLVVELDNTIDKDIDYVTINGVQYDTYMFPSNLNKLYIDMGVITFACTMDYVLSTVTVTMVDDTSFDIVQNETVTVIIHEPGTFVPDDATVKVLELTVNNNTMLVTDGIDNHKIISIVVENEFNLPITKIKIDGTYYLDTEFTLNNNVITVSVPINRGYNDYKLFDLEFTRNNYSYHAVVARASTVYVYGYESADIVSITSVAQFLAMDGTSGTYYRLDADLDFSGVTVNPLGDWQDKFGGCFDGNGHTLENIYMTTTLENQVNGTYFGLFGWSTAYLYDITINNIDIMVTSDASRSLYVGTLAGRSSGPVIDVSVIGDSSITINGITSEYVGGLIGLQEQDVTNLYAHVDINIDELEIDTVVDGTYTSVAVGGLLGGSRYGDVNSSHSSGEITIININRGINFVGGLVGDYLAGEANVYISNSYSTVNIDVENTYYGRTGGLVGRALYSSDDSGILDSYSSGTVSSSAGKLGGLVGEAYCTIYNSFSTSTITSTNASIGMLIGLGNQYRIFNSYKYDGQIVTRNGIIIEYGNDFQFDLITASSNQFDDVNFYYDHLGWSSYFYNFTNLDVEAVKLPILN